MATKLIGPLAIEGLTIHGIGNPLIGHVFIAVMANPVMIALSVVVAHWSRPCLVAGITWSSARRRVPGECHPEALRHVRTRRAILMSRSGWGLATSFADPDGKSRAPRRTNGRSHCASGAAFSWRPR